ncbi:MULTISPECIES: alanine racemase [Brachybacterium]|uniref:alanine racemase n=1 Tax=Brachybacterium TaxID=43668 RepID=UPI000DF1184D|nr:MULTISPECIES: alanine racemase [Brachybacterium]RCS65492.1 amino acid deaminase [Brachybacterium sp. JB7]RCS77046.1 amino acid deaminase [Brachybacterium alimentarium]RCS78911.1 amino acid deaminase [Brachybacterium alimentarium]
MSQQVQRTVELLDKSFPAGLVGRPITALEAPLADFSTPLLVLDEQAMAHNLQVMAAWTSERGLELMPHGKTTMAPVLWRRQLDAGCTGITVATGWQADVALREGIPTVQLANACTDPALLRRLAAHLAEHPEQELVCWADSLATVDLLERELPDGSRLGVLVELGADGGRTGARDEATAVAIAERIAASTTLTLYGAAGYEGALAHDRAEESLRVVGAYCDALAALVERLRPLIDGTPWVSAGGSAYFDLVAASFETLTDVRAILRSGAYIVHDSGFYRGISPLDTTREVATEQALLPAMRAYARVVSMPEPGLALLDAGKRDVPFDEGLPTPVAVASRLGGAERPFTPEAAAEITALNDQHTFLRYTGDPGIAIGDVVTLGLSHPCTAFDKWRLIPVVDADGSTVLEAVETFF